LTSGEVDPKDIVVMLPPPDQGNNQDPPSTPPSQAPKKVEAVFSYKARSVDQLTFHKGDVMDILIYRPKGKWWFAKLGDKKGWIPHNFVKALESGENSGDP
jgi:hypothetical protein